MTFAALGWRLAVLGLVMLNSGGRTAVDRYHESHPAVRPNPDSALRAHEVRRAREFATANRRTSRQIAAWRGALWRPTGRRRRRGPEGAGTPAGFRRRSRTRSRSSEPRRSRTWNARIRCRADSWRAARAKFSAPEWTWRSIGRSSTRASAPPSAGLKRSRRCPRRGAADEIKASRPGSAVGPSRSAPRLDSRARRVYEPPRIAKPGPRQPPAVSRNRTYPPLGGAFVRAAAGDRPARQELVAAVQA
jgi:hypothetical protein